MALDILSDVLRHVQLRGTLLFRLAGVEPWVVEAPPAGDIAQAILPVSDHVMAYHAVVGGSCWAAVPGEAPRRADRGDVLVFAHGDAHVLSSAPGMRTGFAVNLLFQAARGAAPFHMQVCGNELSALPDDNRRDASGGQGASILCGFFGCDARPFNPLLATLPRLLHLRSQPEPQGGLLELFLRVAERESLQRRAGGQAVLERLSEMMFVDLVRRHADALPADQAGWLAGLGDRFVGRALALLHEQPQRHWTVEELAEGVGLSRSALHERFSLLTGQAPMQYLNRWRMQLAADLLARTDGSIVGIALEVGYASEAAFTRAFKKATGLPPGRWRHRRGAPDTDLSEAQA